MQSLGHPLVAIRCTAGAAAAGGRGSLARPSTLLAWSSCIRPPARRDRSPRRCPRISARLLDSLR